MTTKTMLIRRKTHAGQLGLMGRRVAMVNGPGSRARLCLGRSGRTESALLAVSTCTWIGIMKDDAAVRTLGGCDIRIGDAAVQTLGGCDASPRIPSHLLKKNLPSTRSCSSHRPPRTTPPDDTAAARSQQDALSSPLPPQHEALVSASLPRGRPLSAPSREAPTAILYQVGHGRRRHCVFKCF
jgi:hypothetical protein